MSWDRPNYAIPGLMPESSPKFESVQRTNPDGTPYDEHRMTPVLSGDRWPGESFDVIYEGGNPGVLTTLRITMRLGSTQGDVGLEMADGDGLTITDPQTWSFDIDACNIPLSPGEWWGDVECTNEDGEVYTPFTIVLPVLFDGTQ